MELHELSGVFQLWDSKVLSPGVGKVEKGGPTQQTWEEEKLEFICHVPRETAGRSGLQQVAL